MLRIDILTIFPEIFHTPFNVSIIKKAQEKKEVTITVHNLRRWADDKRGTVDDRPYGGGVGMILKPEPIFKAVEQLKEKAKSKKKRTKTILLSPQGEVLKQSKSEILSKLGHLILICGHYEGVDERIRDYLVDEEVSIGDYILTGGEIPALVLVDTVVRLIPGVLVKREALQRESFQKNLLEYPQYTRPENFRGLKVPKILLSGDHKKIQDWQEKEAYKKTKIRRPGLIK